MKQNDEMDVLVNQFIRLYTVKPKVKTIKKKEIQDFQRFIFASTQNHPKYNQIQTDLMMYVKSFDDEIYKKIREAFSDLHNRSTYNQGIPTSKKIGLSRRRAR